MQPAELKDRGRKQNETVTIQRSIVSNQPTIPLEHPQISGSRRDSLKDAEEADRRSLQAFFNNLTALLAKQRGPS